MVALNLETRIGVATFSLLFVPLAFRSGIFHMYDECLCASIDMCRLESHYGGLIEPCADTRILGELFVHLGQQCPLSSRDRVEGNI